MDEGEAFEGAEVWTCRAPCGPKAQPVSQRRATPWIMGRGRIAFPVLDHSRPNGPTRRLVAREGSRLKDATRTMEGERLARWAAHDV